jgi:hypothetical protein
MTSNVEYKHTLGPWASEKSAEEVLASVNTATGHALGPWAKGEVDQNGVAIVAEKPKSPKKNAGKGKDKSDTSTPPAGEPEADDDDDAVLNGQTPAAPLVS